MCAPPEKLPALDGIAARSVVRNPNALVEAEKEGLATSFRPDWKPPSAARYLRPSPQALGPITSSPKTLSLPTATLRTR